LPADVLLSVKDNVVVAPLIIGFGEKDLLIVGAGAGKRQPVNETTSKSTPAPVLSFLAPDNAIRIVLAPDVLVKPERFRFSAVQAVVPGTVNAGPAEPLTVTVAVVGPLAILVFFIWKLIDTPL
jgi:hypothetical protein